ncbi:MAG TPA: thiolase family protein [Dehalococcoidia bacterium]|nr:thiolase family protein [Dehalococcoidia bacterium]
MTEKDDVVIVSGIRTPFSRFGSVLRDMHSSELGAIAIQECLKRVGMKGGDIDELYYGMCIQSEAALLYNVIARQALLKAGLPDDLISLTIDRACCSSLVCVQLGYRSILADEAQTCMAVGAENMSNTPVVVNGHRWGSGLTPLTMVDHLNPIMYKGFNSMAKDAGEGALGYGIGREMLDMWAVGSQQKYQAAEKAGKFEDELVPVEVPQRRGPPVIFSKDDFPKPDTTLEGLAKLKTIYESPSCTAGNSPGLDAGASALAIMKRSKAEEMGIKPLATILSLSSVAREPAKLSAVPGIAVQKALSKAKVSLDEVSVIEINEAFAAMPLVSTKVLADGNEAKWQELMEKTNPNGGAIAIGHPVGASGARILITMMYELRRRGGGIGACGICGGLAQGDAAVIRVD